MSDYIERYWRDATPADAIREPPMVARFRDEESEDWLIDELVGFDRTSTYQWINNHTAGITCQVYDAPDPGEGWRLIDVKKETPKEGDQYLVHPSQWIDRGDCHGCFEDDKFYRRRIEQPKPKYVPFTWEDREQLRGRWIYQVGDENAEQMINKMDFNHGEFYANNKSARQLLNGWLFLESNEPVGKRVQ